MVALVLGSLFVLMFVIYLVCLAVLSAGRGFVCLIWMFVCVGLVVGLIFAFAWGGGSFLWVVLGVGYLFLMRLGFVACFWWVWVYVCVCLACCRFVVLPLRLVCWFTGCLVLGLVILVCLSLSVVTSASVLGCLGLRLNVVDYVNSVVI